MSTAIDQLIEVIASIPCPCWAAGPTAAALHPFDGYVLRPPFHLMTEREHNIKRVGHFIHTTTRLELIDRAWAQGVAVLSPTRTLLHLAGLEPPERVTIALDGALRDGLTRATRSSAVARVGWNASSSGWLLQQGFLGR